MTAIIIVVVVALVFFVSICVVTFMVWKHETEMRTDSLKAIEKKLEVLSSSLSDDGRIVDKAAAEKIKNDVSRIAQEQEVRHLFRERGADPFGWMRSEKAEPEIVETEPVQNESEEDEFAFLNEIEVAESVAPEENAEPDIEEEQAYDKALQELQAMKEREQLYADIDLDFAEIKELVSEMKKTEEEQLTEVTELFPESETETEPEIEFEFEIDPELEFVPEPHEMHEIQLPDIDGEEELKDTEFNECLKVPMQYDVGRSGRKYTEEEIESLIKE